MTNEDNTTEFAEIDYDREKRTGFPEVIFGAVSYTHLTLPTNREV